MTSSQEQVVGDQRARAPALAGDGSRVGVDRAQIVIPLNLADWALVVCYEGLRDAQRAVVLLYRLRVVGGAANRLNEHRVLIVGARCRFHPF